LRPDGNALNSFVRSESDTQTSGEEVWIFLADVASYLIISLTKHSEKKVAKQLGKHYVSCDFCQTCNIL